MNSTSPHKSRFAEYVNLLLQLHELEAAGQSESEAADAVRDAMDLPWRHLSVKEIDLARGLSSDLFSIGEVPNDVTVVKNDLEQAIRVAAEKDEYGKALSILRENSSGLPSAFVAHWRGSCWADLRQIDAAVLFFQEARRLQPSNDFHDYMLLHAFLSAQQHQGALELSRSIAAEDKVSPPLLWMASLIIFRNATKSTSDVDQDLLRLGIKVVERANTTCDSVLLSLFKRDAVAANTLRGVAYDQLDQPKMALESCEFVLHLEPSDRMARYLRALLTRTTNLAASKEDAAYSLGFPASTETISMQDAKFSELEAFQPALAS